MSSEEPKQSICVLVWSYGDGSGFGVVRVYTDEKRAREDFALVKEDSARNYELKDVELIR